jgi:hypothetical protein
LGGRPQKYFSKEERLAARRDQYHRPEYREKRIRQTRAAQIKRIAADPSIVAQLYRDRIGKDPLHNRRAALWKYYRLTLEDYNQRLEAQNNVCGICLKPERDTQNGVVKNLAVDHDKRFKQGGVRGILCARCNRALGLFDEDITALENAIVYLRKWKGIYG